MFLLSRHKFYNLVELEKSETNELMVAFEGMAEQRLKELKTLKMSIGLSFGAFEHGVCPLDPKSKLRLKKMIRHALEWKPQTLWFDHLRFDGHWETMRRNRLEGEHLPCHWCKGKDRAGELIKLAEWIKSQVGNQAEMGFFAVPFKAEEVPQVIEKMAQNVKQLGQTFDVISPMMYHRLIGKPVNYIPEFIEYVYELTGKPVLPIIQIKDLPDALPDKFSEAEIKATFQTMAKPPASGVAWFCWDDAVETGKTGIIKELFRNR